MIREGLGEALEEGAEAESTGPGQGDFLSCHGGQPHRSARSEAGAPTFQQLLAGVSIEPLQLVRTPCRCPAKAASQTPERRNPTELAIRISPSVF